jgi:hypothetical protein
LIVIDVSAGGVLVEAGRPLRPGSQVEVQMENLDRQGRLSARVVRCAVAAINAECGVTYQAALSFNENCDWVCESATQPGYPLPVGVESAPMVGADDGKPLLVPSGDRGEGISKGSK